MTDAFLRFSAEVRRFINRIEELDSNTWDQAKAVDAYNGFYMVYQRYLKEKRDHAFSPEEVRKLDRLFNDNRLIQSISKLSIVGRHIQEPRQEIFIVTQGNAEFVLDAEVSALSFFEANQVTIQDRDGATHLHNHIAYLNKGSNFLIKIIDGHN